MMNAQMRVELASPPDREKLVAPILVDNEQWAEVNQETDRLKIEIYPRRDGGPWVFDLEEVLESLAEASRRLRGGS
jgi:hypothetical protein